MGYPYLHKTPVDSFADCVWILTAGVRAGSSALLYKMAEENKYFSVLALFIIFRETLEAAVIISVLLQYMNRTKPAFKRPGASLDTAS